MTETWTLARAWYEARTAAMAAASAGENVKSHFEALAKAEAALADHVRKSLANEGQSAAVP